MKASFYRWTFPFCAEIGRKLTKHRFGVKSRWKNSSRCNFRPTYFGAKIHAFATTRYLCYLPVMDQKFNFFTLNVAKTAKCIFILTLTSFVEFRIVSFLFFANFFRKSMKCLRRINFATKSLIYFYVQKNSCSSLYAMKKNTK